MKIELSPKTASLKETRVEYKNETKAIKNGNQENLMRINVLLQRVTEENDENAEQTVRNTLKTVLKMDENNIGAIKAGHRIGPKRHLQGTNLGV